MAGRKVSILALGNLLPLEVTRYGSASLSVVILAMTRNNSILESPSMHLAKLGDLQLYSHEIKKKKNVLIIILLSFSIPWDLENSHLYFNDSL